MPKQKLATTTNGLGKADLVTLAEELARLVSEEGLHEVSVYRDGHRLRLRRKQQARPVLADSLELEPSVEEEPEHQGVAITSLVVGLFHPGPMQAVAGMRVKRDQVVGFVESMSINHELRSTCEGTVLEVLAKEGEPVEYGQALLLIAED